MRVENEAAGLRTDDTETDGREIERRNQIETWTETDSYQRKRRVQTNRANLKKSARAIDTECP